MLNFYPGFIDNTNFRYVNIDGKYITTICIARYPQKMCFLDFMKALPKDIEFDVGMFIKKQDTTKTLKELTYNISNSRAELKTTNNNQIDVDLLDKLTNDAKRLRYEIQINNEEMYHIYIYISVKSYSKDNAIYLINRFRSVLYSKMYEANLLNFRHLYGYLYTLPLNMLDINTARSSYANMTTNNVANMFPFFTDTILDKNGVLFGYTSQTKKICNIDIFSDKYTNSNICMFGSSGSGKSYFVKLLVLREYITNIKQYIFDPEGEYMNLSSQIGGEYLDFKDSSKKYINILDINDVDLLEMNFLSVKIDFVYDIMCRIIHIEDSLKVYVLNAIKKAYLDKGITEDVSSMYINYESEKIFINKVIKDSTYMPVFEDILNNLKKEKVTNNAEFKKIIKEFGQILADYSFLNKTTTVDINNILIVFNFSSLNKKMYNIMFEIIIEVLIKKIKCEKKKSVIYLDEVWKFIHCNKSSSEKIFVLFKTIRKLNAGIVAITQDISDFFAKDFEMYGKSIINNSFIKMFFKMEYSDSEVLGKTGVLNSEEIAEISKLNKGSMIMLLGSNIIKLNVKSNEYEDKLIKGEIV